MHFKIEQSKLLEALVKTVPIAEKRSPLPILSHVLFNVSQDKLTLSATDLENGIMVHCDCELIESGQLAIPGKKIFEIVKELNPGPMSVEKVSESRIKIESSDSVFEISGMDGSDFPAWSNFEDMEKAKVKTEKLLKMIDKTVYAASNDESRFNLNGALFESIEDKLRMIGSDGHRLALANEDLKLSMDERKIVPKKGMQELKRILESLKEKEIDLGFEPKNIVITTSNFLMSIRLIHGDYPDYQNVIPKDSDKVVKVNRNDFLRSLRRVGVLAMDQGRGITINFTANKAELKSFHPDLGEARDILAVEYEGADYTGIYNVNYLIDALSVIETETVKIELYSDENGPLIAYPEPDDESFNLVMPMKG